MVSGQSYLCPDPGLVMGVGSPGEWYLCAVWLQGGTLENQNCGP